MSFFKDLFGSHGGTSDALPAPTGETALDIEIAAIFRMLADMMGTENLVIQAGKMNAMALMRSENRRERVLALMRILEEDPMLAPPPSETEIPEILVRMTEEIARIRVRRDLEDRIERKVTENSNRITRSTSRTSAVRSSPRRVPARSRRMIRKSAKTSKPSRISGSHSR